uniref:Glycosyltransferase family 25 n=1 Tax=Pithovirus LCPAC202 TaxID=2506592 RepID=A0A481Z5L1_9VIRU|nr:MAG: glycosyltransferase family 25 [Pithovirus LCPAC202]
MSDHEFRFRNQPSSRGTESADDSVIVYLLTDCPKRHKVQKLIRYFDSSPFFILKVTNLPPKAKVNTNNGMTQEQAVEICRFDQVLTEASDEYPNKYVIVIKDSSIATSTPESLERTIRKTIEFGEWDVCYLTRWLDLCNLYKDPIKIKGSMKVIVRTLSPNGTQALLFSPEGRDIVIGRKKMKNGEHFTPIQIPLGSKLNQEISNKNLFALCTVPNEFEFDVFRTTKTSDLAKLSDCRRPESKDQGPGAIPLLWFIVIVVAVILIAWALYTIGPSYHGLTPDKNIPGGSAPPKPS